MDDNKILYFIPGTYQGKGLGKYGNIIVDVAVSGNSIDDINVIEHHENINYAGTAIEYLPLKMLDAQCIDVDAVSGATMTSRGIIEATKDALSNARTETKTTKPTSTHNDGVNQSMKPGAYRASAQGRWAPGTIDGTRFGASANPSLLEVEVTVSKSAIEGIELITCTDNDHFVRPVVERVIPSIINEQSIFVDTVTGATLTSAAVIKATADCLKQANANMRGFISSSPKHDDDISLSCDVCVVGGGHAGTVAALMALENNATVIPAKIVISDKR